METSVNSDPSFNQDNFVPRLTYNRAFAAPNELPEYAGVKAGMIDSLNDVIAADPYTVLANVARLEDQLASGEPIEARPFVEIKNTYANKKGRSKQQHPPYFDLIRDVLSITNNGSQFEFGDTPQASDAGWAVVYDKCNEIDRHEIAQAQSRIHETRAMLRNARTTGTGVKECTDLYTIAMQQRALIRLRSLAIIARGPELEIPMQATDEPELQPVPADAAPIRAAGRKLMQLSNLLGFS